MALRKKNNNVFLLGLVSLFTDLSTQMIYPLIPEFLISLGSSTTVLGVIEGIAECTASVLRTVFGKMSDTMKNRKLFIYLGYGFSAISKPMLFAANAWTGVLAVKFFDRVGKAARSPARDALLSTSVDKKDQGISFGFNRAMDRIGAVGGPLLALLVLHFVPGNLRLVFLLSIIPAVLALLFVIFVKDNTAEEIKIKKKSIPINLLRHPTFVIFMLSSVIFSLGNSSNSFLILKAQQTGVSILLIPVIWMVYNLSSSIFAVLFGKLSDQTGRLPIIIASFIVNALIYIGFGLTHSTLIVWLLFASYGIYDGLSDGIYRAYIADLIPAAQRGTAYGLYNTAVGLALLPASLLTGYLWDAFNSTVALLTSSGLSLAGFIVFLFVLVPPKGKKIIGGNHGKNR
jgi:MFS family permease